MADLDPDFNVTMPEGFGARLRDHREQRNVSLRTVAEQTKIKQSLLEGLERDDISHWPAGLFRRAYVRAYAHAIGLDPDTVVRDFLQVHPEPVEVIETPPAPPPGFRGLVGSAMSRLRRPPVTENRVTPVMPPQRSAPAPIATPQAEPQGTAGRMPAPIDPGPPPEQDVKTAAAEIDFLSAAQVCTELGRVETTDQLQPLLREAARIVDALGLIVWVWDDVATELRAALAHGYSDRVLAQLPAVKREADNLTAAAFRAGEARSSSGRDDVSGALAIPLLTPLGCAGVLAIELPPAAVQRPQIQAAATFFAAMLAQLVGGTAGADSVPASSRASSAHASA